jgi:phage shock protein A
MSAQPLESRVARLEGAYEQVDRRLDSMDRRLESLDRKVDDIRDLLQWRMTSLILGTWITLIIAIFAHRP